MLAYIARRLMYMVVTFFALSVVVFIIIQLPPGDYLSSYIQRLQAEGTVVAEEQIAALREYYGLDKGPVEQYLKWITRLVQGDLGTSFQWNKPVAQLLRERVPYSAMLAILTIVVIYSVAVPVGIYLATHQYSFGDYAISLVALAGMATPNFMLALILMYILFRVFGMSVGGLFSPDYAMAPWSWGKVLDLARHMLLPILIIGFGSTGGLIRTMRAVLLDELKKQYVVTARAKGVPERTLLFRYPVRIALNPIASTIGWRLPQIVSGETVISIVLSLPTTGPLLYQALISQDMFMAGSIVMVLSVLTVIGTLISDILLVLIDPRISFEGRK